MTRNPHTREMTSGDALEPRGKPHAVEICVRGELSDALVRELGAVRRPTTTTIVVPTIDQAELHSVIRRVEDFGLELLSIQQVSDEQP